MRVPKYYKRVISGNAAVRLGDSLRQTAMERELTTISVKIARDHNKDCGQFTAKWIKDCAHLFKRRARGNLRE